MIRFLSYAFIPLMAAAPALAQNAANRPFLRAAGEGVVSVQPDLMKINVGVTAQGQTAQEAADRNAVRLSAVLMALRQLLGPNADLKTVTYSVSPIYRSQPGGEPPTIVGYTANNTIEVTTADLTLAGRIIDVATQAGANNVTGLRFTLKDPEPARLQALKLATQQARAHTDAIAQGLGVKAGAVLAASEGFASQIVPLATDRGGAAAGAPTPIEVGTFEIRATVTLEVEIIQ
jgi:hypothetical protein